jgi:hypothetical protein
MLFLEPNEVSLVNKNCCGTQKKRLPYGELGSVDMSSSCGCCAGFNAGGLAPGADGAPGIISPGCGCEKELVSTIVEELNKRQRARGDVAQMQRADEAAKNMKLMSDRMVVMESKMDAILTHLKIPQPAVMVR